MGLHDYCLVRGVPAAPHFPDDAKVSLRKENPGTKISDVIGNLRGYFIGSSKVREVIEEVCPDITIEFLPFTLLNHKKREHSRSHLFINPIGTFECLHEESCGIEYDDDGEVELVNELVLDPDLLETAPDLFRVSKKPTELVFSRRLGRAMNARGVTNLIGFPVPIFGG